MNLGGSFWLKTTFNTLAVLGLLFAVIWFGLKPQVKAYQTNNEIIRDKQDLLLIKEEKLASLEQLDKKKDENDRIFDTVGMLWPEEEEVAGFIVTLENLANQKGLIFNSLSISETLAVPVKETKTTDEEKTSKTEKDESETTTKKTAKKTETGTKFGFDTRTDYASALSLLLELEKLPRFNSIDSVNLNKTGDNEIGLKISGYIYGK